MTDTRTLPVVGAAFAAPALLATLATIAPPLLLGAGIAAALVWLFSDDKPKPATATPGNVPPTPQPKRVGAGWFTFDDDEPAAKPAKKSIGNALIDYDDEPDATPKPAPVTVARSQADSGRAATAPAKRTELDNWIAPAKPAPALPPAAITPPTPRPQAAPVYVAPAPPRPQAAPVRKLAPPSPAIAPAPISAPHSPAIVSQATPAPSVAVAAPEPVKMTPGKFQLISPKVTREDLAAVFQNGALRLTRKSAVAALVSRGVKQSTAYHALRKGGRFTDLLEGGEYGGLLVFKS